MDIEQLRDYCISKKGVTEDFPFDNNILVFKVLGKIFVLIGLHQWEAGQKRINLKCDPDYALELRDEYEAVQPGYHMNKKHWNTIDLSTNTISLKMLTGLIDHSYAMVVKGLPKTKRDSLQ